MEKIDVINRALGFLGEQVITNPDAPETAASKHIVGIFDQGRREVLRLFPWNFAECWKEIDKTTAPPFGYSDAYALPQDFIRLLVVGYSKVFIGNPGVAPLIDRRDYRLLYQGAPDFRRVIALDNAGAAKLKISYTADVSLLHLWDPSTIKVLAFWLALDAAKTVTGQDGLVKLINELLTEALKDAAGVDGGEQSILEHTESRVQTARDRSQYGDVAFTPVQFP